MKVDRGMALQKLDLYIIRRILGPFSLGVTILLMVLSLERLLRLVQVVSEQNAPGYKIFEFLFYLLPHYLGLAIPASLFIGILLTVRRLHEDSELAIMQASGISLRRLYRPVMIVVVPATLLMFLLTGYLQPHSRYTYRASIHSLVADNPLASLRPGTFVDIDDNTVIRADYVNKEAGILEGVFIAHKRTKANEQLVIGAQSAELRRYEGTQEPVLQLKNGNLIRENLDKQKTSTLNFQSYPWKLPSVINEPYGLRGQDEREMVLGELLKGHVEGVETEVTAAETKAEFHARVIQSLSLLFLALWAVPLALLGMGRTSKATGIILGGMLFVFFEKLIGLGESYAAHGGMSVWLVLWGPFFVMGLSGWFFMCKKIPKSLKLKKAAL